MGSMRINHGRAAARTVLHGVLVAAVVIAVTAPQVVQALGLEGTGGVVGGLVVASVVIARLMALPAVEALLRHLGISVQDIHDELGGGPAGGGAGGSRGSGNRSVEEQGPGSGSSGSLR
jgi:hypothetical protein